MQAKRRGRQRGPVTIRPIPFGQAQSLLYEKWVKDNRKVVEAASHGMLGYLHIKGMNLESFYKFEEELYSAGRWQGWSDHRRAAKRRGLDDRPPADRPDPAGPCHPHRAAGRGPEVIPTTAGSTATWSKPIVVLCNQNSFSNAEIFRAPAIQTLRRGKLVGVPTAGGVISTGSTSILDVGLLRRVPRRGWFLRRHRTRHGAQRRGARAHRLAPAW